MNIIKKIINKSILIPIFIILFTFLFSLQDVDAKPKKIKKTKKIECLKDTNSTCSKIDSCQMMKQNPECCKNGKGQCRMKDNFIDKDNDGINDNRCKGLGFGKQMRKGKCCNKKN